MAIVGTASRSLLGLVLVGSLVKGQLSGGFALGPWALGLAGFPGVLLTWQWLPAGSSSSSARRPAGVSSAGRSATCANCRFRLEPRGSRVVLSLPDRA